MQDVNHQLFTESVEDEISISVEHTDDAQREKIVDEILHDMDLIALKSIHPLSLSGGQKQRVAIGSQAVWTIGICWRFQIASRN